MSPSLSADSPYHVVRELEPDGHGGQVETTAIFLTASRCPIGCSMCDLHRFTLDKSTPVGAIPRQIRRGLNGSSRGAADGPSRRSSDGCASGGWVKLYNSGNFFDPQSIPASDYGEIAKLCGGFERVIVENHPRFGEERLKQFQKDLRQPLEVAVGLETVQPRWLARMKKQMTRDQFDRYAAQLHQLRIDLRVFLIVGVPGVEIKEAIRWARLSLRHAIRAGARHVSMIPARDGNGWGPAAGPLPSFSLDDWLDFQATVIADAGGRTVVTLDLWEMAAEDPRVARLRQVNLTQRPV
ncbi:MAG: Fe-S oxidoreductase [Planctomycetota bacterium]|nr:Fe-S oxidoreductase [Planctomycetota bacterium]